MHRRSLWLSWVCLQLRSSSVLRRPISKKLFGQTTDELATQVTARAAGLPVPELFQRLLDPDSPRALDRGSTPPFSG